MKQYDKHGVTIQLFDSVDEVIDTAGTYFDSAAFYKPSFTGRRLMKWEDVVSAAKSLWTEGDEIINGMLAELDGIDLPRPTCRKRRRRWSEDNGDEVDYDRMRLGQPFWRESRRAKAHGSRFVTILVDVGANCNVAWQKLLWRGAAAVIITHLLEEAGYRVELRSTFYSRGCYKRSASSDGFVSVLLKGPEETLDMSAVTIAVSGWFYRTVILRALHAGKAVRNFVSHHGVATRPPQQLEAEATPDENRISIADVWSRQTAIDLIRKTIEQIEDSETSEAA